jgi:two-component sensor histidine kinase
MDVSDRDWFRQIRDSGSKFIQTGAIFSKVTHRWIVASALRRNSPDGAFNGALVLGTAIDSLVAELEHSSLPRNYEIALLDGSGHVFASSSWETMDAGVMQRLATNGAGFYEIQPPKGDLRQAAIVPLGGGSEFYTMVSAAKPTPIALENVSAFGNFALPLLAWLLALITAWLAMDRLVLRWLDYLRRIASLYASGKLSVQPLRAKRQAPGEINELADTMEEMAVRIRDRTGRMETALATRDAAMKEIHHRVRNNLQIINSLLSLQGRKLKDPAAAAVLSDARLRINALSLVHASLYEHDDISTVSTRSFFSELASNLGQALGAEDRGIRIACEIDEGEIVADVAIPLALFAAEAVTNSMKHAFPNSAPPDAQIRVIYRSNPDGAFLSVEDNGVGYNPAETGANAGVGSVLKAAFAKQVGGRLEHAVPAGGGRIVRIVMPPPEPPVVK